MLGRSKSSYLLKADNALAVLVDSQQIRVFLNDELILKTSDTTFRSGRLGLFCDGMQGVTFSDLRVNRLPEP